MFALRPTLFSFTNSVRKKVFKQPHLSESCKLDFLGMLSHPPVGSANAVIAVRTSGMVMGNVLARVESQEGGFVGLGEGSDIRLER